MVTPRPCELPDWLISRGRHWVTTAEVAELLEVPQNEVPPIAARWRAKGQAFAPTRGAYVPIPAEYRSWRAVPASHFIDPMMRYLDHEYYVGYLSAAEVHGAAHQRPQVFQVITDARLNDRIFERVHIEFTTSAKTATRPTTEVNTPTGTMKVSVAPEITGARPRGQAQRMAEACPTSQRWSGGLLGDGTARRSTPLPSSPRTTRRAVAQRGKGGCSNEIAGEVGSWGRPCPRSTPSHMPVPSRRRWRPPADKPVRSTNAGASSSSTPTSSPTCDPRRGTSPNGATRSVGRRSIRSSKTSCSPG